LLALNFKFGLGDQKALWNWWVAGGKRKAYKNC